jgi:hypothetical protein
LAIVPRETGEISCVFHAVEVLFSLFLFLLIPLKYAKAFKKPQTVKYPEHLYKSKELTKTEICGSQKRAL